MKSLRLSLKLYNTFHSDLLALKDCDVAFTALVKLALYYRVRGRKLNIFVPECYEYRYRYRRAFTKEVITIDDEVTILFLTTMICEKRRMAFVRSVLYDALISPPCGSFFKDSRLTGLESSRLGRIDLSGYDDVLICTPGTGKRTVNPRLLRPTVDMPEWVPREWFAGQAPDPQSVSTEITSAVKMSDGKEASHLDGGDPDSRQDTYRRKKRRKKKKKKAPEVSPSGSRQDSRNASGILPGFPPSADSGSEAAGVLEYAPSPDESIAEAERFPMLEEEDF